MGFLSAIPIIGSVVDAVSGSSDQKKAIKSNERINAQNIAMQRETNAMTKAENDRQYDLARNTILYKTQDAKNSGIHPLYALGANTLSSVVTSTVAPQAQQTYVQKPRTNFGEALQQAIATEYDMQVKAKNLQLVDAEIALKKAQTLDVISQAKQASDLSRSIQTGRTFGDPTALKLSPKDGINYAGYRLKSGRKKQYSALEDNYGDDTAGLLGLLDAIKQTYSNAFGALGTIASEKYKQYKLRENARFNNLKGY